MKKETLFLILILFAAAGLRFWGIWFGLPDPECRSDETEIVFRALRMITGDFNPHYFVYPGLYMYLYYVCYFFYFCVLFITGNADAFIELLHRYFFDPTPFMLIARAVTATMGTLTVYLVYRMGKRLRGVPLGMTSAALLAFCFLHGRDSHFAVTDVPSTFFMTASLYFILELYQNGGRKSYLLAGLLAGLAAATKYTAILLLVPLLLAHLLRYSGEKRLLASLGDRRLWISLLVLIIAFLVTTPYTLLDFPTFWHDFLWQMQRTGHGWVIETGPGYLYHLKITFRYGLGLIWEIFLPFILIYSLFCRDRRFLVLNAFVLVNLLVIGRSNLVFARYGIPVLPSLAILTAYFFQTLLDYFSVSPGRKKVLLILVTLFLLAEPAYYLIKNNMIISKTDTRVLCKRWVESHCPNDSYILISGGRLGMPYLHRSRYTLEHTISRAKASKGHDAPVRIYGSDYFELALKTPGYPPEPFYTQFFSRGLKMSLIQARGIQYVITNSSILKWYSNTGTDFIRELEEGAELIKVFNPYPPDRKPAAYDYADGYFAPYGPVGNMIRPGPLIKIYRCPSWASIAMWAR